MDAYDVIIVGGGMVGASLALGLKNSGLRIAIIEATSLRLNKTDYQPSYDARSTALSWGTRLIYQRLGMWDQLSKHVTPIKRIHVSDKGHFGATRLNSAEYDIDALGYVVENRWMGQCLFNRLRETAHAEILSPMSVINVKREDAGYAIQVEGEHKRSSWLQSKLLVVADGGRSSLCRQLGIDHQVSEYGQCAIVTNLTAAHHHGYEAFERFTENGPMALLPLGEKNEEEGRLALVWTVPLEKIDDYLDMSDADFCHAVQEQFGGRLGDIVQVGERFSYPLALSCSQEQIRPGLVVVGNAAHSLHPVAGQGYNLALRDVMALSEILVKVSRKKQNIAAFNLLQSYLDQQLGDQQRTIMFSDQVMRFFSNQDKQKTLFRDVGLVGMDLIPGLKRQFSRYAMGLGGVEARL